MMTEIIEFLLSHWLLSGGFAILLVLLLANEFRLRALGTMQLSAQESVQLMNHNQAVLIDIRDPQSFEQAHIVGSMNLPISKMDNADKWSEKVNSLSGHKKKPIILACAHGVSCIKIAQQLRAQGFEQAYCLAGGIPAWQKENLPLVRKQ